MLKAARMGPVIPKVTPGTLAALERDAVLLAAVLVALPAVLSLVEDVVAALTPDLVTEKACAWAMIPEFETLFPMKLI
jgi:hypothetical protein